MRLSTDTPQSPVPTNSISPITLVVSEDIVIPGYPTTSIPLTVVGATTSPVAFLSSATSTELSFNVTATQQGVITITVPTGALRDRNSIQNVVPSNTITILFDNVPPALMLIINAAFYARNDTLTGGSWSVYLVVSEIPRRVSLDMVRCVNAVTVAGSFARRTDLDSGFAAGSNVYSFRATPLTDGPVFLTITAATFHDLADNWNVVNSTEAVFDTRRPIVTLKLLHPPVSNFTTAYFLVDVNEELQSLTLDALTVLNGVAHDLTLVNSTTGPWLGQTQSLYEFWVDPVAEGVVSVQYQSGSLLDLAGNPCVPSANISFLFDNSQPVMSLTTRTRSVTNTIETFVAAFSEVPFFLSTASFVCVNCTVAAVVRLGPVPPTNQTAVFVANPPVVYNVTVVATVPEGDVSVYMPAFAVQDRAKNGNVQSNQITFHWDSIPPTVVVTCSTPLNANQYNLQVCCALCKRPICRNGVLWDKGGFAPPPLSLHS